MARQNKLQQDTAPFGKSKIFHPFTFILSDKWVTSCPFCTHFFFFQRKEKLLKKQHREALLLDSFLAADGISSGRSLRDRKPVTYTFGMNIINFQCLALWYRSVLRIVLLWLALVSMLLMMLGGKFCLVFRILGRGTEFLALYFGFFFPNGQSIWAPPESDPRPWKKIDLVGVLSSISDSKWVVNPTTLGVFAQIQF